MERTERGRRAAKIMSMRDRGYSHAAIAGQHGISERQVQRIVKEQTEANRRSAEELKRPTPSEPPKTGRKRAKQLLDHLEDQFRSAVSIAHSYDKPLRDELVAGIAIKLFQKNKAELAEMLELIPEADGRIDKAA